MKYFIVFLAFILMGCQHRIYVYDKTSGIRIEINETDLDNFLKMSDRKIIKNEMADDIGDRMVIE